eukprot:CAMPEP_0118695060 /NCGR_PEP_ID=MMETSP0800-20121206/12948_1 /TAXON_ID=210618 ORGANISM="Striatella unipunctata, Strain CCMP2910" /NCGR_SAMPLE_ID=MMETSP0800 /ASSEMBLY_ACC=CAM_ASM_000638 /LENGTH=64 /DNA_ID=CAMNT_0006593753 /DNA_START=285 /DNA_END=479 /DNA_ORIENTATION=+
MMDLQSDPTGFDTFEEYTRMFNDNDDVYVPRLFFPNNEHVSAEALEYGLDIFYPSLLPYLLFSI